MTASQPATAVDDLLGRFIAAWHAGEAPSAAAYCEAAEAGEREELAQLLAAFMELAPTVAPGDAARRDGAGEAVVQELVGLERGAYLGTAGWR